MDDDTRAQLEEVKREQIDLVTHWRRDEGSVEENV